MSDVCMQTYRPSNNPVDRWDRPSRSVMPLWLCTLVVLTGTMAFWHLQTRTVVDTQNAKLLGKRDPSFEREPAAVDAADVQQPVALSVKAPGNTPIGDGASITPPVAFPPSLNLAARRKIWE